MIVHTPWNGQPPNIIEDQVTYPIVTSLLAAPSVERRTRGTNDVRLIMRLRRLRRRDGSLLGAFAVLEYMQQIKGRGACPRSVHPTIGPDATGAGWVYEYAIVDHNRRYGHSGSSESPGLVPSLPVESVPGVAEVATLGGLMRRYR